MAEAPALPSKPWAITAVVMVGTLAAVMGSSTTNTALPAISAGLSLSLDQASWIATAYMLANVIAIPCTAWLGQLLGKPWLFGLGVLAFLLSSVAGALAWDFNSLVLCRVGQGAAAGLIMPVAQSIMFEAFPAHQRGTAMGVFGLGALLGPAIGPTLGGYLVDLFGWRAIFTINVPLAIACLACLGVLPKALKQEVSRFDAMGFVLLALGLASLQLGVTYGPRDGWGDPFVVVALGLAALGLSAAIAHALSSERPLVDLHVFAHARYNAATLVSMAVGLGLFGTTFLVPLFLGNLIGHSALEVGLLLLPGSLAMGVAMIVAGRLSDLMDGRIPVALGLLLTAWGLHLQAQAGLNTSDAVHAWAHVVRGVGIGLVFSPLSALSLQAVLPSQVAQATGLFNLTRQLAGSVGIAALNGMLSSGTAGHLQAFGEAMTSQGQATRAHLAQAQAAWLLGGHPAADAAGGSATLLARQVAREATALAYGDAYAFAMAAVLLALLVVPFVGAPRRAAPPSVAPSSGHAAA